MFLNFIQCVVSLFSVSIGPEIHEIIVPVVVILIVIVLAVIITSVCCVCWWKQRERKLLQLTQKKEQNVETVEGMMLNGRYSNMENGKVNIELPYSRGGGGGGLYFFTLQIFCFIFPTSFNFLKFYQ